MEFKKMAAAGALALSLFLPLSAASTPASAGTDVFIGVGVGNGCWNGPFYNCGYGRPYYRPYARYPRHYDYDRYRPGKLSCGQARQDLRDRGYRSIKTNDCRGTQYSFRAVKNGRHYLVRINALNGRIIGRSRI